MGPLWLYRLATNLGLPLIEAILRRRISRGKEDPNRLDERKGLARLQRPNGRLVWIHAASIGEAQSSLVLITELLKHDPEMHVLQTTGTVTSSKLMQERLPARSFHQFVPIDRGLWVRRFLDHWQPDVAIWMESELWPNLLQEVARRRIPSALLNARISHRTYFWWRKFPRTARALLKTFSLCLAQTEAQCLCLKTLGAEKVMYLGNLKSSAEPLPVDTATLEQLKLEIGDRPVWLAASTHPGEESIIAAVYQSLKLEWENLLLIIVPRHPTRGAEVVHDLKILGLNSTLRSIGEKPTGEIYVADTLGELGLFYRLARVAFIGGSMFSHGGHNPLEAALLGCVAVLGPDMNNFSSVAQELLDAKGAVQCSNSDDMGKTIGSLLRDEEYRSRFAAAATHVAIDNADAATRFHGEVIRLLKGNYG